MMFGIGSTELVVILVVALLVIGPAKLPDMARSLGKALGEFRRVSSDVKRTIEMEAEEAEQKTRSETAKDTQKKTDTQVAGDAFDASTQSKEAVATFSKAHGEKV